MPTRKPSDRTAIKLVLADVDGTLVTKDKLLTERAADAVKALKAAGIRFAITSGRPPRGMAMLVDPLRLDTPIAGFNGGAFVEPDGRTVIETKTLPRAAAAQAITLIEDKGLDVWVYTAKSWLIRDAKAPHVEREQWTVKFAPEVVEDFEAALDEVTKVVGVSDDLDLVAATETAVQEALGNRASAARSQPYYLDVTHPEANKGGVVKTLSQLLKIAPEAMATLGDMPNDVLMFEKSGMSIAMGNASKEVQAKADYVTASYEDEGFAKAVETYILGKGR